MNGKRARYLRGVMASAPSLPSTKRVNRMLKRAYNRHGSGYILPFVQRVQTLTSKGML